MTGDPMSNASAPNERYVSGYNATMLQMLSQRSLAQSGAFALPHFKKGMRMLDCGCGPGAMTVELAQHVAPGEVIGIDLEGKQFEIGRKRAAEKNVANVRLQVASIYELPFGEGEFDGVFVHAVLYHLAEPRRALAEIRRVLKPGGVVAVRDVDNGGNLSYPHSPELDLAWSLIDRAWQTNGADPFFGRKQREVLQACGFGEIRTSASFDNIGFPELMPKVGDYWADFILQAEISGPALANGWATREELDALSAAFRAWGRHPSAFFARARCEAVAFKPA
jgi:ubiquinone/menaquinone biosynthesis C-methylase UbiE